MTSRNQILIIDDDPVITSLISDELGQSGFQVAAVSEISDHFLDFYASLKPAIILLDIMIGQQNGLDLLRSLQQLSEDDRCHVILLSAKHQPSEIISGLAMGAIDYFVKPPDFPSLIAKCKALTSESSLLLIADDDPVFTEMVRHELAESGFRTVCVSDGTEVVPTAEKYQPNLILLDRMMPGMEGLSIVAELKIRSTTNAIPIIIVSAKRREQDIVDSFKLDIEDYITKPIRPQELVIRVKRCLNR